MDVDKINGLKGVAIIAVVAIHFLNIFSSYSQNFVVVDQSLRFCVPLFTALSGLALATKYTKELDIKEFYLRRLFKLLPMYFLWVTIYWLTTHQPFPFEYHLYFVPMIFQAYLIFPFILPFVKKMPWTALIISAVLQIVYFSMNHKPTNDQHSYIWFVSWQFYFVLGIFLAFINTKGLKLIGLVVAGLGLIWSVRDALGLLETGKNLIWATRFTRIPIFIYSLGLTLFFVNWTQRSRILSWLGKNSYQIYLGHVLILKWLV